MFSSSFRRLFSASSSPSSTSFFRSDSWTKTVGTIGAIANWTIPGAALAHIAAQKSAAEIDPTQTATLALYSSFFMRWALAITPPNYPLLACHAVNVTAQCVQLARYTIVNKENNNQTKEDTGK